MKKRMFYVIFSLLFISCYAFVVFASMGSQSYNIPTSVLSGGGAIMSSNNFQAVSTLGQSSPLMNPYDTSISENYRLFPGFWYTIDKEGTTVKLNLTGGWSMISLPVLPHSNLVQELFPGAMVIYGFEKGSGYMRLTDEEELDVGSGYWILLNEEKNFPITGQPIHGYTFSVNEDGWYMIGGCTYPAQVSIDNGSIGVIYTYIPEVGYQRLLESEKLEAGRGYWILLKNIIDQTQLKVEMKNP